MKKYLIKVQPLTHLHIGSGREFEPINYIIDSYKAKTTDDKTVIRYALYEFDEMDFYANLDESAKDEFLNLASAIDENGLLRIYKFINKHKATAKKSHYHKIAVDKAVYDEYNERIGKIANKEKGNKNVINNLAISKTYTDPNTHKALIPGSSIKGAISTAYQEFLYNKYKDYDKVKNLMLDPIDSNIFKNLLISDSTQTATKIFKVQNFKRNINKEGLSIRLELLSATKELEFSLIIKDENKLNISDIAQACNDHYLEIFDSIENDAIYSQLDDKFKDIFNNLTIKDNEFLLRIGKHSGARAVTIKGERKIEIKQGKNRSKIADQETTIWLANGKPLGWVLCSFTEIK